MNAAKPKTPLQFGCLSLLVAFSILFAFMFYPYLAWKFGAGLAFFAFVSLFLRVGWVVPFTIAGFYFGISILDPLLVDRLSDRSMPHLVCILVGTIGGAVLGAKIDNSKSKPVSRPPTTH